MLCRVIRVSEPCSFGECRGPCPAWEARRCARSRESLRVLPRRDVHTSSRFLGNAR
ncbi:hypothetical protein A176_004166 [Myxococcus hansupus]|uniref:Uncharacterized protein n=1 Tax=Pseudomyxococcus hansupus TaxID=1297742 RepID=A0A0H4WWR3_9BACT|nr:hypothetical protein A176_004166 [Myxococcus hansupus]